MKLFGNIKNKKPSLVNVIKYPNELIIETINSSDTGVWLRSISVSRIPNSIDTFELGETILVHLDKSKKVNYKKYDLETVNNNYKKVTKKKTIKKQMENAKLVSVYRENKTITVTPHRNGGTSGSLKGYESIEEDKLVFTNSFKMEEIAKSVIQLFEKCK